MKVLFKGFALAVFILLLFSCSETEEVDNNITIPSNGDYIVFGNIYGECVGDCRELFLITDNAIYQDANIVSPLSEVTFDTAALSSDLYEVGSVLLDVPDAIINNTYDQQDLIQIIADFDYYISGSIDDKEFELIFDEVDSVGNIELYDYTKLLITVINQL